VQTDVVDDKVIGRPGPFCLCGVLVIIQCIFQALLPYEGSYV